MKKVRQQVFETNSSSTHSISIADGNVADLMDTSLIPNQDGNIILEGGEFGWEVEDYNHATDKANYMAIYAQQWAIDDEERFTELVKNVIKEQTGAKDVIFNFTKDDAYIDHQSVESKNYHYVFEDKEKLRQFIFNPNSSLHTDNDNY